MSVFLPKNRSLPASYNYLRESKTDKSLEYTLKKKDLPLIYSNEFFRLRNFTSSIKIFHFHKLKYLFQRFRCRTQPFSRTTYDILHF